MRRGVLLGAAAGLLNAGVAVAVVWLLGRRPGDYGWYSYTPMPARYSDYLSGPGARPGWELALIVAAALAVLDGLLAVVVVRRLRRSR